MSQAPVNEPETDTGTDFINALLRRDFERIQSWFRPEVKFRGLVPFGVREGETAAEAVGWFRKWFGHSDELTLLTSSVDTLADRLHIAYRIRVRYGSEYEMVEQQSYSIVENGQIIAMNLVCSGFRPDPESQHKQAQPDPAADAYYDAGTRGCAEGPLDEIAGLMRKMQPGQTLEVHAVDPSVMKDLPAWCRLVGHDLIRQEGSLYLIRHK